MSNTSVAVGISASTAAAATSVVGLYRDALPTHFTFKIQSFSLLTTTTSVLLETYESNDFEAGGYKWKLVFYPNGKNTQNHHHVSMYLKIVDTNSLPRGWTVDVLFRFFVLDQIRDKYLILGDIGGRTRRFHEMKTTWGYDQLLPLTTLNDSSNGYIVDDTCVFGVEVFPCKNTGCGDCLTMVRFPSCVKYTWKIEKFSKIKKESIYSDEFGSKDYKWRMQMFPKGDSTVKNENLSLFLNLNHSSSTNAIEFEKVYAKYTLRVRDQSHKAENKYWFEKKTWFISSQGWGLSKFMRLDELNDQSKGYLVKDTCIVEVEVTVLGTAKRLS